MSVINIEEDVLQTKTPRDFYSSTPQPKLNSATNLQDGESIRTRRPSLNNVKENTDNGANAPQERRVNRHISAQGHTNNFGHRDISLPLIDSKVTKQGNPLKLIHILIYRGIKEEKISGKTYNKHQTTL